MSPNAKLEDLRAELTGSEKEGLVAVGRQSMGVNLKIAGVNALKDQKDH